MRLSRSSKSRKQQLPSARLIELRLNNSLNRPELCTCRRWREGKTKEWGQFPRRDVQSKKRRLTTFQSVASLLKGTSNSSMWMKSKTGQWGFSTLTRWVARETSWKTKNSWKTLRELRTITLILTHSRTRLRRAMPNKTSKICATRSKRINFSLKLRNVS